MDLSLDGLESVSVDVGKSVIDEKLSGTGLSCTEFRIARRKDKDWSTQLMCVLSDKSYHTDLVRPVGGNKMPDLYVTDDEIRDFAGSVMKGVSCKR